MSLFQTPSAEAPLPRSADWSVLVAFVALGALIATALFVDPMLAATGAAALAAAIFVARTFDRPLFALFAMIPAATLDVVGRIAKVSGVTITIYQLCALLTVVAVAVAVSRGTLTPASSPMDVPVLAFIGLAIVAVPAAQDLKLAVVAAASLASSAVMLFLIVWIVRDIKTAGQVILVVAVVGAVLGILAVAEREKIFVLRGAYLELWQDGVRARVTFKDPNILGAFLAPASLLSMTWAMAERRSLVRIFLVLCALASTAGLFATLSRGAVGGWILGIIAVVAFGGLPWKWRLWIAGGLGASLFVVAVFFVDPAWVQAKIFGVGQNASAMYRVWMARGALQMFADHPMGIGPGNYPVLFPLYRDAVVKTSLVESHTAYLTVLVETGFFGFAAFVWLLWRYFTRTLEVLRSRVKQHEVHILAVGAFASGVALAAQAFTYSLESSKILWFTFGMGMVAYRLYSESKIASGSEGSIS